MPPSASPDDTEAKTIEASNVSFTYPDGTEAVRDVSVTVETGEFFGFLGPNGAGKTTMIKMFVTLLEPTAGTIRVNGIDVRADPLGVRTTVGYTAQDTSVDPELTARENLEFMWDAYHMPRDRRADRVEELLELVDLADVADEKAGNFSGGMQKRLDIATSLLHDPQLAFLDEPTTGLDPKVRLELWDYFREINRRGTTMFLTTQYLEEADELCERIAVIADGEIVTVGSPAELKAQVGGDTLEIEFENATASELDRARAVIEDSGLFTDDDETVGLTDEGIVVSSARARRIGTELLLELREAGFTVVGFNVRSPTLDDVFLHFTGGTLEEAQQETAKSAVETEVTR